MKGFADIHHHLIYGMDDGPASFDEMTKMLQAAYENGVSNVVATPHAMPGIEPFQYSIFQARLQEAQTYCDQQGWKLQIHPGAEIFYTPFAAQMVADGKIPAMANSQNVLLEFEPDVELHTIETAVRSFRRNSFTPILAHIERYRCLMKKSHIAARVRETEGVTFQVNCSTVIHGRDGRTNKIIKTLLEEQLIDYIASDAHNTHTRPCKMRSAYEALLKVVDVDYADQLMGVR